ncbi:MAG TPA: DUF4870 domain-containing protein [Gemmatimonadaceae bacterium]
MSNPSGTTSTSSTGLASNVAGALCYLLGLITGVLFLLIEKNDKFVRFHAAQSIAVSLVMIAASIALSIVSGVLGFVPVIGWIIGLLLALVVGLGSFILWILLMWKAFQGQEWEAPIAGPLARKMAA